MESMEAAASAAQQHAEAEEQALRREVRILYPFKGYGNHARGEALLLVRGNKGAGRPVVFQMIEASLSGQSVCKPSPEFGYLYAWLMAECGDDIFQAWMDYVKKLSTET